MAEQGTARCPDCRQAMTVEYVSNGVYWMWHGVHCGWGREFSSEDVRTATGAATPERLDPRPLDESGWF